MPEVVLTSDRALFTDFSDMSFLGFGLCLPYRLVPKIIQYKFLSPKVPVDSNFRAKVAPYGLSKLEAALISRGFSRESVIITPPEHLEHVIDDKTKVVGVHVVDPLGLAPVSWTLKSIFGGGTACTEYEFRRLMQKLNELRKNTKQPFKIVIGGPGAWQLRNKLHEFKIDVLFEGEGEKTAPKLFLDILNGKDTPKRVLGEDIYDPKEIPPISTPSRNGIVQVMRGCPRRCQFCSPSMFKIKYMPMDIILEESRINLRAGAKHIDLVSEDILLYGAQGINVNEEKVLKLFSEVQKECEKFWNGRYKPRAVFSHTSVATVLSARNLVRKITEICGYDASRPIFPQVGFESGSPDIVRKYFIGKPRPWSPEDWPRMLVEAAQIMNENYWYPCYTYIIGFPGEKTEDYRATIRVINEIHDAGLYVWTFPLLLVPMGGSILDRKIDHTRFSELSEMALETITIGWKHSIWVSRRLYRKLIEQTTPKGIKPKILFRVGKYALNVIENAIKQIESNPEIIEHSFSKVNIRNLSSLLPKFFGFIMKRS
ncbi:MAG TPA: B12-binding domain-containing radical SAM protein [Euryarchaeota archaeon]|nr:B12-binding domain-containing radical SAM protein [Euryarchaeota archaeon]